VSDVLRTPEERFANLYGFPFTPNYIDTLPGYEGLRLHYLDEGPREADKVFLCLHGHPTWSYLWRRMIPFFTGAGYRVLAPDFFGYGRSDKPADEEVHTFDFHRGTVRALIEALDLTDITLVVHEWGGTVGLTVPMEMPERFSGLFVMTTFLATGRRLPQGYADWRAYCRENADLNVRAVMARTNRILKFGECNAYGAPFPDVTYKAALRRILEVIPDREDAPGAELSRAAAAWWSEEWRGSSFMAMGQRDPLVGGRRMMELLDLIAGAPDPLVLEHAGHFTPEWGDEFADRAIRALAHQDALRAAPETEKQEATEHESAAADEGGDGHG